MGRVDERPGYFEQPRLGPLQWYLDAFDDLCSDRRELGSIPWQVIDRYAERHGMDGEAFERFKIMVRALDGVFLKISREAPLTVTPPPKRQRALR